MAKKISVLTKIKTRISTRTMLLIALGLLIVSGAVFGLAPLNQQPKRVNTIFNVSQAGIYTGVYWYNNPYSSNVKTGTLVSSVVYSGQDGSNNLAVQPICAALKEKGIIKYDIDYIKSKAANVSKGYCPKKGALNYQAWNPKNYQFFNGSCWGGHDIYIYYQVDCAITAPYIPPYTQPYTSPYSLPYTTTYLPNFDYQLISQNPYSAVMTKGSVQTVSVDIKNTGKVAWYKNGSYGNYAVRLGAGSVYGSTNQQRDYASEFMNSDWLSVNRPVGARDDIVAPGATTRFTFQLKAPTVVGNYKAFFTPVVEKLGWMKDNGMSWQIQVRADPVLTVNSAGTGNGGVYINTEGTETRVFPAINTFTLGKQIYIIPLYPKAGSAFEKWVGCDSVTKMWNIYNNTCIMNMNSDKNVSVYYKKL